MHGRCMGMHYSVGVVSGRRFLLPAGTSYAEQPNWQGDLQPQFNCKYYTIVHLVLS